MISLRHLFTKTKRITSKTDKKSPLFYSSCQTSGGREKRLTLSFVGIHKRDETSARFFLRSPVNNQLFTYSDEECWSKSERFSAKHARINDDNYTRLFGVIHNGTALSLPRATSKLLTKLSALIIRHCLFLEADEHSVRYFEEIVAVFQPAVRFIVNLKPVKNHKWFDGFNSNQRTKTGTKRVAKTIPYLLDSTCADYSSVCSVSLLGSQLPIQQNTRSDREVLVLGESRL